MIDAFLTYCPIVVMWLSITVMIMLGISVYFYGLDYTVRRFLRNHPWVSIPMLMVTTAYGGTKLYHMLNFPRTDPDVAYIIDAGSYATNDHVLVSFRTVALPPDARIILGYAPADATNETQFVVYADLTLAEWRSLLPARFDWGGQWGDRADNYRWYIFTLWTPAPSVHTNGVLNCYGMKLDDIGGVLKRTVLIENGSILSPDEILGDFEDSKGAILDAETYEGEERKPYELEEYFDINR